MKNKGFTLLELVVVIIILGVLATLGITQYGRMVEKARGAEARIIFGEMRKLAIAYRLQNGTIDGITSTNLNIGTAADQIPSQCRSSHYWYYTFQLPGDPWIYLVAYRCKSGGKEPQSPPTTNPAWYFCVMLQINLVTGRDIWIGAACDYSFYYW